MIKSKRKLNKQAIINLRRYAIRGGQGWHYYPEGTVVQVTTPPSQYGSVECTCLQTGLIQIVRSKNLI